MGDTRVMSTKEGYGTSNSQIRQIFQEIDEKLMEEEEAMAAQIWSAEQLKFYR